MKNLIKKKILNGGEKVNIPSETIVKFKNGTELRMPSGIYEKISFDKDSIMELKWEENGMDYKVQFFLMMYSILQRQHRAHLKVKMVVW